MSKVETEKKIELTQTDKQDLKVKEDKPVQKQKTGCCSKKDKKPQDKLAKKEQTKLLLSMVWEQKFILFLASPFVILSGLSDFMFPNLLANVIDSMKANDRAGVQYHILTFLVIILIGSFCRMGNDYLFGLTSERLGKKLRQDLFKSLLEKDVAFYDEGRTGDLLSRLNSDTQVVQDGLSTAIALFIRSICIIIAMIIIMFTYSVKLTLIAIVMISPALLSNRVFMKMTANLNEKYQEAKSELGSTAQETISNIRTVKAFADERGSILTYEKQSQIVYQFGYKKSVVWGFFFFGFIIFQQSSFAGMMWIVGELFYEENLTVGKATAYLLYMRQIVQVFFELATHLMTIAKVQGSSYKIAELIIKKPLLIMKENGLKSEVDKGQVDLKDVLFSYPSKKDVTVLNRVNIRANSNEVLAIVGQSGCGKSSIMKLLERFYDPVEGKVLYNDQDLAEIDNKWYHQTQIAIVQQEPAMFSGTIEENIKYGVDFTGLTEEEIKERFELACTQAMVNTFMLSEKDFPIAEKTIVGERGIKLSGGQKQRLAIARALIRKPRVLLLDEATSALDAESEHQVQQALDVLMQGDQQMTIVVIAHRLSTIKNANNIVVMSRGNVIEQGTHDNLIALNGAYRKLVDRQLLTISLGENIKK